MSTETTSRFIAVVHRWFVSSKGFVVKELSATNKQEADAEAALLFRAHQSDFTKADVCLVELRTGEKLPLPPQPRKRVAGDKLTWRERITGRIWSD